MDEDMILPDDFTDTPTESTEDDGFALETDDSEVVTEVEDTTPTEEPAPQEPVTQPQTVKIKFDHEERELSVEEAAILAQKGMNYERAIERAQQQARDAYIAEQGFTWNDKPITTEAEYKQALMEKEIMDKYQDQVPEEIMQEIIESRRDREQRRQEREAAEKQSKQDAEFGAFFEYFKDMNDRDFDPKKDTIPDAVKQAFQNGQSLKHAYMEHHNKELRNRLRISEQNISNQRKAPIGSVTAGGGVKAEPVDPFLEGFNSI